MHFVWISILSKATSTSLEVTNIKMASGTIKQIMVHPYNGNSGYFIMVQFQMTILKYYP